MLNLKDIHFNYPNSNSIFKGLTLDFSGIGLYRISGSNGSGKTTLLKIIAGLITPSKGQIRYQKNALHPEQTSFLDSKESSFFFQMKGKEGLDLYCKLNQIKLEEAQAKLFLTDPLFEEILDSEFHRMSYGMKRLFLLTLAFIKPANIFLLDEPFVGMDSNRLDFTYTNLENLSKNNLILVSSHNQDSPLSFQGELKLGV